MPTVSLSQSAMRGRRCGLNTQVAPPTASRCADATSPVPTASAGGTRTADLKTRVILTSSSRVFCWLYDGVVGIGIDPELCGQQQVVVGRSRGKLFAATECDEVGD